jgi:hypothetical protein
MSVEILSVSLSDESIQALAIAVANRIGSHAQDAPSEAAQPPLDDPWAGTNTSPTTSGAPGTSAPQQPAQSHAGPVVPHCVHGEMRYVPGGFSKSTGRAYEAFYGCNTPRGTPNQCKSVKP